MMYLLLQLNERLGGLSWSETSDAKRAIKHLKASTGFSWIFYREEGWHAREVFVKELESLG